jgi:kinesin family protein 11
VLAGYESTVFAYGQTGTGKTHTMEGDISSDEHMGVIPRASKEIFAALQKDQYFDSSVTVSYLEIYNEELADLLVDQDLSASSKPTSKIQQKQQKQDTLMICEDKSKRGRGMYCRGLSEVHVKTAEDILDVLQGASERRQVGETKMNKTSSRSHCLFTLTVATKERTLDGMVMERTGKLHMVDLAGSECAKTAGNSTSTKERERKNINQSLLTLGRVITSLRDKAGRIPYRDSKLTRLLQESLGGRCKTVIIATVSPSVLCCEETLSTLSYAQRAHGIKTKPVSSLRCIAGVAGSGGGGSTGGELDPWTTNEGVTMDTFRQMETRLQYMEAQVSEAQGALGRKHDQMKTAVEEAGELRTRLVGIQDEVTEAKASLEAAEEEREQVKEELRGTAEKLGQTTTLLQARVVTEDKLLTEGGALLANVDEAVADGDELHMEVEKLHEEETVRRSAASDHARENTQAVNELDAAVTKCEEEQAQCRQGMVELIGTMADQSKAHVQSVQAAADEMTTGVSADTTKLRSKIGAHEQALQSLLTTLTAQAADGGANIEQQLKDHAKKVHTSLEVLLKGVVNGDTAVGEWADVARTRQGNAAEAAVTAREAREEALKEAAKHAEDGGAALLGSIEGITAQVDGSLKLVGDQDELATTQAGSIKACGERLATHRAAAQETMNSIKSRVVEVGAVHHDISTASGMQIESELQSLKTVVAESLAAQQQTLVAQREEVAKALARLKGDTKDEELKDQISNAEAAIDESTSKQLAKLEEQQQALSKALSRLNEGVAMRKEHASLVSQGKEAVATTTAAQTDTLEQQQKALHNVCAGLDATLEDGANGGGECPALQSELKALGEAVDSAGDEQTAMLAAQEKALEAQQREFEAAREEQATQSKALVASVVEEMHEMLQTKVQEMTEAFEARITTLGEQRVAMGERNGAMREHGDKARGSFHEKRSLAEEKVGSWEKTTAAMSTVVKEEALPRAVEVVAKLAQAKEADGEHRSSLNESVIRMGKCSEDVDAQIQEGGIALSKAVVIQATQMQQANQEAAANQQAAAKVWSEGSHETVRAMGVAIEQNDAAATTATTLGEEHSAQATKALSTDAALTSWKVCSATTTDSLDAIAKSVAAADEKFAEDHAEVQGGDPVDSDEGTVAGLVKLSETMAGVSQQQRDALDTTRSATVAAAKQLGDDIRQPLANTTKNMLAQSQQDGEVLAAAWKAEGEALGAMRGVCAPVVAAATAQTKELNTVVVDTLVNTDASSVAVAVHDLVKGVETGKEEGSSELATMAAAHLTGCEELTARASTFQTGVQASGVTRVDEVEQSMATYGSLSTAQAEQLREQSAAQQVGLAGIAESAAGFCKGPLRMEEETPIVAPRKAFAVNRALSHTAADKEVLAAVNTNSGNATMEPSLDGQKQPEPEHEPAVAMEGENLSPNMLPKEPPSTKRATKAKHLTSSPTRSSPKKSKSIGNAAVGGANSKPSGMRAPRSRRASTTD